MSRTTLCRAWLAAALTGLGVSPALADALPNHTNGPFTGLFGFADSAEGATLAAAGESLFRLNLATASHNIDEVAGPELLQLDGETTRLAASWRYGIGERLELGVEIPYLWHESGGLDLAIDNWHSLFGLPEGARSERERDRLDIRYADGTGDTVRLTNNSRGVGDIRLLAGWQLAARQDARLALRFGIKLPTGDAARLTGSGAADISVGIAGDHDRLWGRGALSGFWRADIAWLGTPEVLAARSRRAVGQVAGGLGYRLRDGLELQAQTRLRSAVFDSAIDDLGGVSAVLTAGAEFRLGRRLGLGLAFAEDIKPSASPDISFRISLRSTGSAWPR